MAVDKRSGVIFFPSLNGCCHGNQFLLTESTPFLSRCITKRNEIATSLLWKSNRKSCAIYQMAPFLMTLDDPNFRRCCRFFLLVGRSSPIISESTQPIFENFFQLVALRAWMIAVKLACDRSRVVATTASFCLFNPQNFFVTVTNV